MSDKIKNVLIGFFTLIGIVITIGIIMFLKPTIGDGKKIFNVRFANIQGIHIGTRVLFAGKAVGEVVEISTIQNARSIKRDEFGRLFYYQLKLKVDSSVDVYNTDLISIQTIGLVGEKSINITPLLTKESDDPKIINDEIIYAKSIDSFESTAAQIANLGAKAEKTIDNISNIFEELKVSNLIIKLDLLFENVTSTSVYLSKDGKEILNNLKELTESFKNEKTTVNKLINDQSIYLKLDSILSKANTMMNDVNNYGVLFHYNKKWQRQRERKANILYGLRSEKDFKSYFDNELSEMNSSISRINQLVDSSKNKDIKFTQTADFKNSFYSLLKQTEMLLEHLKLYNEKMNETISQ